MDHRFNDLPVELREYLIQYLDQRSVIYDLRQQLRIMLEKYEMMRRNNQRLTLQVLQQMDDIRNLEFILANGLDEETQQVARELDFANLSDSDDETVYEISDSEDVNV